jgi:hypothetical protein
MNYSEYLRFMDQHPEIQLGGYRIGRRGCPKDAYPYVLQWGREEFERRFWQFELCVAYLKAREPYPKGTLIYEILLELEHQSWAKPVLYYGVVLLAALSVGYKLRRMRGTRHGYIIRNKEVKTP